MLAARLLAKRMSRKLGVQVGFLDSLPTVLRRAVRRMFALDYHASEGRCIGEWLSLNFDDDEPPTLDELVDAHPIVKDPNRMNQSLLLAGMNGYIIACATDEGLVFLPGPMLR